MKLFVQGMTCGHCVRTIQRAIRTIDPVAAVSVDLEAGTVAISGDVTTAQAVAAIEAEGYAVGAGNGEPESAQAAGSTCCGCKRG